MSRICHEMMSRVFGVMSSHDVTSLHRNQGCARPDTARQVACAHVKNAINTPKIPCMSHIYHDKNLRYFLWRAIL